MKSGSWGAPLYLNASALIQKGPLDRHAQREDAVETYSEGLFGRWRIGLQDLQVSECPRELGNQQK